MTLILRITLFLGSLCSALFFLSKIRKAKIRIDDTLFWILFAFAGIILSVFPGILNWLADLFGIISPVNLLFLILLFVLILRNFSLTVKVSQLQMKLNKLGQDWAIDEASKDKCR